MYIVLVSFIKELHLLRKQTYINHIFDGTKYIIKETTTSWRQQTQLIRIILDIRQFVSKQTCMNNCSRSNLSNNHVRHVQCNVA